MTTEQRKTELGIGVDATGAKRGLNEIKDAAKDMAQELGRSGKQASKAVEGIGDGGEVAAKKIDSANRKISDSIKRTASAADDAGRATDQLNAKQRAYLQSLERQTVQVTEGKAAFLELRAAQLGISDAASGLIAKYRAAEQGQSALGISAGQTAAALRQLPAQFSDIVVSLQAGQAPLTVFLQQGAQIKDSFGGIGPAAKALGGAVAGLVNPFTIAAAAAGGLAVAYNLGSKEADAYRKALVLTGNAAGTSVDGLSDAAERIGAIAGTTGQAADALAQLAATGNIASRNLEGFALVAVKLERAVGTPVAETVKQFEALGKAPVEASKKLSDSTGFLTAAIFEQIVALEKQGKETEAAALAQKAFSDSSLQRTEAIVKDLGLIERGWRAVKLEIEKAGNALLNIGRTDTIADQIKSLETLRERTSTGILGRKGAKDATLAGIDAQIESLKESERLNLRAAAAVGERTEAEKAAIAAIEAVGKANEKAAGKQEQLNKALAEYRENLAKIKAVNPNSVELDPAKIAKTEAAIRKQFEDKGAIKAYNAELQKQSKLVAELSGLNGDFAQEFDLLTKAYKKQDISLAQLTELQKKLLAQQPAIKKAFEAEAKAASILADELDEASKARADFDRAYGDKLNAGIGIVNEYGRAIRETNELTQFELSLVGQTTQQREIALGQYRVEQDLKREILRIEQLGLDAADQALLIEQARGTAAEARAGVTARAYSQEFKKTADDIERFIGDALSQGFANGKSLIKSLVDSVKVAFARLVLRPIIAPIAAAGASLFTGAANAQGVGGAGGFSSTDLFSAGKTIYQGFSTGFAGLSGQVASYTQSGINYFAGSGGFAGQGPMQLGGFAQGAGSAAGIAAGVAGGVYGGRLISGGYSAFGGSGNSAVNTGTAVGAVVGSIVPVIGTAIGALVGGLIGGVVNRVFGRKLKDFGVEGELGSDGFEGNSFKFLKGGVFKSDKTELSAVDPEIDALFDKSVEGIKKNIRSYAETLNIGAESIESVVQKIKISFKGKSEEEIQKQIVDALTNLGDGFASALIDIEKYARGNETATQTLERLVVVTKTVDGVFNSLGVDTAKAFGSVGLSAVNAKQQLIDLAGGIDAFVQGAQFFSQNFLTEAQQIAPVIKQVQTTMESLGFASVDTKEEFANLVTGLDLSTEAGQTLYTQLIAVAPAFLTVVDYADSLVQKAKELAAAASNLDIEFLEITGDNAGAKAARRAAALENADPSLRDKITRNFEAEDQRDLINQQRQDADILFGKNLEYLRLTGRETEALNLERERELSVLPVAARAVQTLIFARQDEITSAQAAAAAMQKVRDDALKTVADTFSGLQRAIAAERTTVTDAFNATMEALRGRIDSVTGSVGKLTRLSDTLRGTLDRMRLPGTEGVERIAAQAQIQTALAIARAGGPLPDADALANALSVVSQPSEQLFATLEDFQRDFLQTAAGIGDLAKLADGQLTIEQKTLAELEAQRKATEEGYQAEMTRLDGIFESAQRQIDVLNGVDVSVKSVGQAVADLVAALTGAKDAGAGVNGGQGQFETRADGSVRAPGDLLSQVELTRMASGNDAYYLIPGVNDVEAKLRAAENTAALTGAVVADTFKSLFGQSVEYFQEVQRQFDAGLAPTTSSIQGFAVGTNYVPNDMTARIHQGERIIPAADNRELMARLQSPSQNNDALVAEVRALRGELQAANIAIAQHSAETARLLRRWEGDGLPAERIVTA